MATSEANRAGSTGAESNSSQDSRATAQPPRRYTDWMSYAAAVTKPAQAIGATYSSDSEF